MQLAARNSSNILTGARSLEAGLADMLESVWPAHVEVHLQNSVWSEVSSKQNVLNPL